MNLTKKIIIGIAAVAVLLLLADWGVNVWVNKKLPQIISEKNNTHYNVSYDTLEIALWAGDIKLKNIKLSPKTKLKNTTGKLGIYAIIKSVEIKKFKIWDILFSNRIKAKSITINQPEIVLYKLTQKAINNSRSLRTQIVEPFRQVVVVPDIYVNKGNLEIIYVKNNKPILNASNITIQLEGLVITDDILERKIPFSYQKYSFSCDSLYYRSSPVYHIHANKIQTENKGLSLQDFEMLPDISRRQFVAQLPKEKDLYSLKAKKLDVKEMDWGFREEQFFFNAEAIVLDQVAANIYRSKEPKDDLKKKPLYNKLLRELKFPLKVDTLIVKNSLLQYEEEVSFDKGPGKISFHKFNLFATHLQSAFGQKKMPDVSININCLFMNTSRMKVDWRFNVLDNTDGFNIRGSILDFDVQKLGSFSKPYSNLTQKGKFDEVYFNFTGNDKNAKGDFALKYHDLKVTLYKKKDPEKKSKLKSAIANLLVKNDSDGKAKNAEVEVERIPEKSFYNFLWRCLEQGIKKILI